MTKTSDPLLDRILSQREDEFISEFEREHSPDFFPPGTTAEQKLKHIQKIRDVRKRETEQKHESFERLDAAVQEKNIQDEETRQEQKIKKKARIIYEKGLVLDYSKRAFRKIWYADSHILQAIMYIAASYHVSNIDEGIHLHVNGTTQSGKSDSVKASLKFIHPNNKLTRTFSDKWLFYAKDQLKENMMVFSDDTQLSPDAIGLFRNILTSWDAGVIRGTVINHKSEDLMIPRHVNLLLTSIDEVVEESEDGQDESRFLSLEVRRSTEDEKAIRKFVQEPKVDISIHLRTIHKVWEIMPVTDVKLHPVMDKEVPIRDFKRYLALIKCNAILHNRTETTDKDCKDIDKFLTYSRPMVDATTSAYTRKERAILGILKDKKWVTVETIQSETRLSLLNIYRALRGRKGTFEKPDGGLMAKEKRLQIQQKYDEVQKVRIYEFKLDG